MWRNGKDLGFQSRGREFEPESVPLVCVLGQGTLSAIASLHPGVVVGT